MDFFNFDKRKLILNVALGLCGSTFVFALGMGVNNLVNTGSILGKSTPPSASSDTISTTSEEALQTPSVLFSSKLTSSSKNISRAPSSEKSSSTTDELENQRDDNVGGPLFAIEGGGNTKGKGASNGGSSSKSSSKDNSSKKASSQKSASRTSAKGSSESNSSTKRGTNSSVSPFALTGSNQSTTEISSSSASSSTSDTSGDSFDISTSSSSSGSSGGSTGGSNSGGTSSTAPLLAFSPLTHDFGSIASGSDSLTQVFTLTNSGTASATGCTAANFVGTNAADFTITGDTCGTADLAASASCTITARVTPSAMGARTAHLTRDCSVGGTVTTTANSIIATGLAACTATQLIVYEGNHQGVIAGGALTNNLIAQLKDAGNNPCAGLAVTWSVLGGGGSISTVTNPTNVTGLSSISLTTGTTAAINTVQASYGALTPITFTAYGLPTNALAWFDASNSASVVESGGDVSQWSDLSGSANHATQATGAEKPEIITSSFNGKDVIRFDGSDDFLSFPAGFSDFSTGMSFFALVKPTSAALNTRLVEFGTNQTNNLAINRDGTTSGLSLSSKHSSLDTWTSTVASNYLTTNGFQLAAAVFSPSGRSKIYKNGQLVQTGSIAIPNNIVRTHNYMGKSNSVGDAFFAGDIAEMLMYARELSDSERNVVESYVSGKFSLATTSNAKGSFFSSQCIRPNAAGGAQFTANCATGLGYVGKFISTISNPAGYGADQHCQALAQSSGLPNSARYVAWASESGQDAYCRLMGFLNSTKAANCGQAALPVGGGPWYQPVSGGGSLDAALPVVQTDATNPTPIQKLTSCTPSTGAGNNGGHPNCLATGINRTELGVSVGGFIHTATNGNGTYTGSCPWNSNGGCVCGYAGQTDLDSTYIWFGGSDTTGDRQLVCMERSAAELSISDDPSYDFGTVAMDASSSVKTFTLTNTSAASTYLNATALSITSSSAAFEISNNTCGGTLAAGANCTFDVTFYGNAGGTSYGSLIASYNDGISTTNTTRTVKGASGPGCTPVYVATTGNDRNSGCASGAPKRTIGNAIASIKQGTVSPGEIQVCAGTYNTEAVLLDYPVSIKGGYSCGSWTRTATYGYPNFDGTNETIVQNGAYSTLVSTLTIAGSTITSATTVDGLTIQGSATGTNGSQAVLVQSAAEPTISNNKILGGATSHATGIGSMGLYVSSANPHVLNNKIHGGSGSTPAAAGGWGSFGVYISGTATATQAAGRAFEQNNIYGGTGTCITSCRPSVGLYIDSTADLDIIDNVIDGGSGTNTASDPYGTTGIISGGTGAIKISKNRVYGGEMNSSNNRQVKGMLLYNGTYTVLNNMIHSGGELGDPNNNLCSNDGLWLQNVASPIVRHNTIFSVSSRLSCVGSGLHISTGVSNAVIENNIIMTGGARDGNISSDVCMDGSLGTVVSSLKNNLMPGTPSFGRLKYHIPGGTCTNWQQFGTVAAMQTHIGAAASGNIEGYTIAQIMNSWTLTGWADLIGTTFTTPVTATGWTLLSNGSIPCTVSQSSLDTSATITEDLFGATRTSLPSVGAHEFNGTCL